MITKERLVERLCAIAGELRELASSLNGGEGVGEAAVVVSADERMVSVPGAEADVTPLDDPKPWKSGKGFRVWSAIRVTDGRLPLSKGTVMVSVPEEERKFEHGETVRVRGDLNTERMSDGGIRRTLWVKQILGETNAEVGSATLREVSDVRFGPRPKEGWEKAIESNMPEGEEGTF